MGFDGSLNQSVSEKHEANLGGTDSTSYFLKRIGDMSLLAVCMLTRRCLESENLNLWEDLTLV